MKARLRFFARYLGMALSALAASLLSFIPFSSIHAQATAAINNDIVFSVIAPLTGPLASVGKEVVSASQSAVVAINAQGGIQGRKLVMQVTDDESNGDRANTAALQAASTGSVSFVNCFGTVSCKSVMEVAAVTGLPLLGPIAGASSLRADNGMSYALRPGAEAEVQKLLTYINGLGMNRLAVFVQDDGFGRSYFDAFNQIIASFPKLTVVKAVHIDPKTADYAKAAKELLKEKSDSVLLLANVKNSAELQAAMSKAYPGMPLYLNLAGQATAGFVSSTKESKGLNVFATVRPSPWQSRLPLAMAYRKDWAAHTGKDNNYSYLGFEAYSNTMILAEVLRGIRGPVNRLSVNDALARIDLNVGGMLVKFNPGKRQGLNYSDWAALSREGTFLH